MTAKRIIININYVSNVWIIKHLYFMTACITTFAIYTSGVVFVLFKTTNQLPK